MGLVSGVKDGDWVSVRQAIAKIGSIKLGPTASPTFAGLTLTGLTASRLASTNASKGLASVSNLASWVAGTANEIDVADDGDGTITVGLVNPLIVGKGGTGVATLTDHGLLLGSGTDAITPLGVATNGQLPIGSTGADPVLALLTGTSNQISVTPAAGSITLSLPQDIHTGASPTFTAATIGSVVIPGVFTATQDPTGFVDRVATPSWDDGTYTFTITGNHDIYINGVKTTKTTASKQITDATGLYYIYYNVSGVLTASTIHPGFTLLIMATVYWNTTTNKGLLGDERHGIQIDAATHDMLHYTVGSRYESGLAGVFDNTTLAIALGKWHDEDIEYSQGAKTTCNVLYHNGDANFEWDAGATVYYKMNGANLRYNNGNALADVGANRHVAMWIFTTNDVTTPIVALMGQREDVTLANARANNKYESLTLGTLPFQEMKLLYRVILKNTGSPPTWVETEDLRSVSNVPAGTYVATAHGVLTGLANDDHTQYTLLAGRSGGQTIIGSTVIAEDLTLKDNSVNNNTITVTQAIAAYTHSQIAGGDSVHVSTTENTNWDTAYTHSGLTAGNPHSVTPTELGLVIGTNVQAYDAGLTSLAGLTFASASFLKCTAENTYAVRTITETKQDLSLNAVENTALSTWAGTTNVTTLGTIATGVWNGTDVAIADGGTGQGTAQLAINALSAVSAATNEHVLTKDTATGNAIFKAATGGSTVGGRRVSAYRSSSQSINATTWTVVVFDTELYDKLGEYNNSTGRFTASVAGYYHITASGGIKFAVAGKTALLDLYYNNTSEVAAVYFSATSVDAQGTTSKTVYLAQNDYIDVRVFHYDSVARNMNGTIMETYLTIDRVED